MVAVEELKLLPVHCLLVTNLLVVSQFLLFPKCFRHAIAFFDSDNDFFFLLPFSFSFFPYRWCREKREKRWEASRWDEAQKESWSVYFWRLASGRAEDLCVSALRLKMKDERKRRKKGENEEGNIKIALVGGGGGVRPLQRRWDSTWALSHL